MRNSNIRCSFHGNLVDEGSTDCDTPRHSRPNSALITLVGTLAIALAGESSRAADPQPYTVTIDKTGDAQLNQALQDASTLISLAKTAPVGPFALVTRAQKDMTRFTTALKSYGYYQGKVSIEIAGLPLAAPDLNERLEQAPADPPVPVTVTIDPGPLFHLRKIEIQGQRPAALESQLGLTTGAPALASEAQAAREKLLQALQNDGYALAKIDKPVACLVPGTTTLDLVYRVTTGPQVQLGRIEIKGLSRLQESFVRRRLLLKPGERFNAAAIEKARQDLYALGVFSSVRARVGDTLDAQGRMPIKLVVAERPLHAVNLGAAYATDLGGSLSVSWQHRNLLGSAEQLRLNAGATQLGGNSTIGFGYNISAAFVKPDFLRRDQSLQANLEAFKQHFIAYDQQAVRGEVLLNRRLAEHWSASVGLALEQSRITQVGETRDYTLVGLPLTLKYDDTNSLLDPTHGVRASATVTPTQSLTGSRSSPFMQLQLAGSAYLDLGKPGRSVLALRGLIATIEGADRFDLPPDKRVYAGGSTTVRGYKFQSIGPRFPSGTPQGGTSLVAGTVEFRQRFLDNWGAVAFVDAGQVSADGPPLTGQWRYGLGVGARYYTGFGPIRVDVAVPLNSQTGSGSFELYVGLGQAF